MKFRHKAIYGMTDMGKTWLMKRIAVILRRNKQKVLVYSGVGDLDWPKGCKTTFDIDVFEKWLGQKENFGAHVFIDEGRVLYSEIGRKTHRNINNLFTMGRHKGYTAYVATQYPTSIPPAVRVNCPELYCFRLGSAEHARLIKNDYGDINVNGERIDRLILRLDALQFFHVIQPNYVQLTTL